MRTNEKEEIKDSTKPGWGDYMNWAGKRMRAGTRPIDDERRCALFAFVLVKVSNSHQRDLQSVIGVCFLVAAGRELP
jgi:hypothetical protein